MYGEISLCKNACISCPVLDFALNFIVYLVLGFSVKPFWFNCVLVPGLVNVIFAALVPSVESAVIVYEPTPLV